MSRVAALSATLLGVACATSPGAPTLQPPPRPAGLLFEEGEVLAYRVLDAGGRVLGRTRGTFTRTEDGFQLVTRVELSGLPGGAETIEHATELSSAFEPRRYKRLSSRRGRFEIRFHEAGLDLSSELGRSQLRRERVRAPVIVPEDMMLLALLVHRSAVLPGRAEVLDVFRPDSQVAETSSFRMWSEPQGHLAVECALGRLHLDDRWHVMRFESREAGLVFEREATPGEPIPLLVQAKLAYARPESADWDDQPIQVSVSGGALSGVLSVPRRRARWADRRAPPVLFVSDRGPKDRYGHDGEVDHGTWAFQDRLAREGFIVLRLDDRGAAVGSPPPRPDTGPWTRTPDLEAAAERLLAAPEADPSRLVVVGHGEGALLAARIATSREVAALVLLAPRYRGYEAAWAEVVGALSSPAFVVVGLADAEVSWRDEAQVLHGQLATRLGKDRATLQAFDRVDHLMKEETRASTPERYRDASRLVDTRVLDAVAAWVTAQTPGL